MKKIVLLIAIVFSSGRIVAFENLNSKFYSGANLVLDKEKPKSISKLNENQISAFKKPTIDNLDTVMFDMFNSNLVGNKVSFPIKFFSSESPIFALDFSFKYNQTKLLFDTIINFQPTLFSALFYYNPSDSVVRFTSSGNGPSSYPDSVPIAVVRFTVLSGTLTASDLNTVKAFLNGDPCSSKVSAYSTVGINDVAPNQNQLLVYPNPSNGFLNINSSQDANAELIDISGKGVIYKTKVLANQVKTMELDNLSKGIYMLKVFGNNGTTTTKVVVK